MNLQPSRSRSGRPRIAAPSDSTTAAGVGEPQRAQVLDAIKECPTPAAGSWAEWSGADPFLAMAIKSTQSETGKSGHFPVQTSGSTGSEGFGWATFDTDTGGPVFSEAGAGQDEMGWSVSTVGLKAPAAAEHSLPDDAGGAIVGSAIQSTGFGSDAAGTGNVSNGQVDNTRGPGEDTFGSFASLGETIPVAGQHGQGVGSANVESGSVGFRGAASDAFGFEDNGFGGGGFDGLGFGDGSNVEFGAGLDSGFGSGFAAAPGAMGFGDSIFGSEPSFSAVISEQETSGLGKDQVDKGEFHFSPDNAFGIFAASSDTNRLDSLPADGIQYLSVQVSEGSVANKLDSGGVEVESEPATEVDGSEREIKPTICDDMVGRRVPRSRRQSTETECIIQQSAHATHSQTQEQSKTKIDSLSSPPLRPVPPVPPGTESLSYPEAGEVAPIPASLTWETFFPEASPRVLSTRKQKEPVDDAVQCWSQPSDAHCDFGQSGVAGVALVTGSENIPAVSAANIAQSDFLAASPEHLLHEPETSDSDKVSKAGGAQSSVPEAAKCASDSEASDSSLSGALLEATLPPAVATSKADDIGGVVNGASRPRSSSSSGELSSTPSCSSSPTCSPAMTPARSDMAYVASSEPLLGPVLGLGPVFQAPASSVARPSRNPPATPSPPPKDAPRTFPARPFGSPGSGRGRSRITSISGSEGAGSERKALNLEADPLTHCIMSGVTRSAGAVSGALPATGPFVTASFAPSPSIPAAAPHFPVLRVPAVDARWPPVSSPGFAASSPAGSRVPVSPGQSQEDEGSVSAASSRSLGGLDPDGEDGNDVGSELEREELGAGSETFTPVDGKARRRDEEDTGVGDGGSDSDGGGVDDGGGLAVFEPSTCENAPTRSRCVCEGGGGGQGGKPGTGMSTQILITIV